MTPAMAPPRFPDVITAPWLNGGASGSVAQAAGVAEQPASHWGVNGVSGIAHGPPIGPATGPPFLPSPVGPVDGSPADGAYGSGSGDVTQQLQLQWQDSAQKAGCGLANLGNTCFLNSTLQCLAHLPPLADLCQRRAHKNLCQWDEAANGGKCVACLLEMRIRRSLAPTTPQPDRPQFLVNNMTQRIGRSLVLGRQEDAHEFLRMLLDAAERDELHTLRGPKAIAGRMEPPTAVQEVFGGVLTSDVTCGDCGEVSSTRDPLLDLSLELQGCQSVIAALRRFTALEQLSGPNAYKCGACNRKVTATKQLHILEAPTVLVVHLKRFSGLMGTKITRQIDFPERLSLRPFCSPSSPELLPPPQPPSRPHPPPPVLRDVASGVGGSFLPRRPVPTASPAGTSSGSSASGRPVVGPKVGPQPLPPAGRPVIGPRAFPPGFSSPSSRPADPADGGGGVDGEGGPTAPEYRLYGVLVHQGLSAQSGHYYAFVQAPEGQWNRMNDGVTYPCSAAKVRAEAAYMLFYCRTAPRPYTTRAAKARAAERAKLEEQRQERLRSAPWHSAPGHRATLVTPQRSPPPAAATRVDSADVADGRKRKALDSPQDGAQVPHRAWGAGGDDVSAGRDDVSLAPFGPLPQPAERGLLSPARAALSPAAAAAASLANLHHQQQLHPQQQHQHQHQRQEDTPKRRKRWEGGTVPAVAAAATVDAGNATGADSRTAAAAVPFTNQPQQQQQKQSCSASVADNDPATSFPEAAGSAAAAAVQGAPPSPSGAPASPDPSPGPVLSLQGLPPWLRVRQPPSATAAAPSATDGSGALHGEHVPPATQGSLGEPHGAHGPQEQNRQQQQQQQSAESSQGQLVSEASAGPAGTAASEQPADWQVARKASPASPRPYPQQGSHDGGTPAGTPPDGPSSTPPEVPATPTVGVSAGAAHAPQRAAPGHPALEHPSSLTCLTGPAGDESVVPPPPPGAPDDAEGTGQPGDSSDGPLFPAGSSLAEAHAKAFQSLRDSDWPEQVREAVREYVAAHPHSTPDQAKGVLLVHRLRAALPDDLKAATMGLVKTAMQEPGP